MDEQAFRQTLGDVRDRACVFQRSVLQGRCACQSSRRVYLAEREIIGCASIEGYKMCESFMHILKFKAAFVLRIEHPDQPIPYAKAVRLQVGAANGLRRLLGIPSQGVPDIQQVLNACIGRYGEFEQIPYEQLFDSIRSTSRRGD